MHVVIRRLDACFTWFIDKFDRVLNFFRVYNRSKLGGLHGAWMALHKVV